MRKKELFIFVFGLGFIFLIGLVSAVPVNITGCGAPISSNTDYILQNDIGPQGFCLALNFKNNVNIDLNGKNSGEILLFDSSSITIHNGTIRGTSDGIITKGKVSKILVENLNINSNSRAFDLEIASQFLIRNVTANTSYGFDLRENVDIIIRNSTMFYNNLNSLLPDHAFRDVSRYSKILIEDSNLSFSKGIRLDNNVLSDYFLRNSDINETVIVSSTASGANVYNQHRVIIGVKDSNNKSVPATLTVLDNGVFPRVSGEQSLFKRSSNPSSKITIPTPPQEEIAKRSASENFLTFELDGLEGFLDITFEVAAIRDPNAQYQIMSTLPGTTSYITESETEDELSVSINMLGYTPPTKANVLNLTLSLDSTTGFSTTALNVTESGFLLPNVFNLSFANLRSQGITVVTNDTEDRVYLGNLSDKWVGNDLVLNSFTFTKLTPIPETDDLWLTESLNLIECTKPSGSCNPSEVNETTHDFSNYTITTKTPGASETTPLNLTGVNSIIPVGVVVNVPQPCTLTEMLDLNNDGNVTVVDAVLILREIGGKSLVSGESKNCIARGFSAP